MRRVAPPPSSCGAGGVGRGAADILKNFSAASGSECLLSALSYVRSIYMQVLHCVSQPAYHADTRRGPKTCTAVHIWSMSEKPRDWLYGCTGSCWRACHICCACHVVRVLLCLSCCAVLILLCVSCVCRVASGRLVLSRLVLPCRVSCMCMYVDFAALFFQRITRRRATKH